MGAISGLAVMKIRIKNTNFLVKTKKTYLLL